ncbi:MAG: 1-acyl-sn-glycerol-3-phosphate acyltransferase [Planctomycetes bacterium]|nr:1-acyl-sn-glycerol-3-phosphate acyltransferase [Planctomycetota bacterium]
MDADLWGLIALGLYALVAGAIVFIQPARCPEGWAIWWLYVVHRLYVPNVFHWRANGRCPFPPEGPAIIIANHRSPVDPLMIWMNHHLTPRGKGPIRVIGFVMAREYYEQPGVIGWICRAMQSIPIERDGKDVQGTRQALKRLKEGKLLGIFPEGGINTGPGLREADVGVAWLALTSRAPVYPVFLHGTPQRTSMTAPFYTFSRVRVSYGEPVDLSAYYGRRKNHELLREVTDLLMQRLAETGGLRSPRGDTS